MLMSLSTEAPQRVSEGVARAARAGRGGAGWAPSLWGPGPLNLCRPEKQSTAPSFVQSLSN